MLLKVFAGDIPSNKNHQIDNAYDDEHVITEGIADD